MKKRLISAVLAGTMAMSLVTLGGEYEVQAAEDEVIELTLSHNWVEGSSGNGYI